MKDSFIGPELYFIDREPSVVQALQSAFSDRDQVAVFQGDILEHARGAIVSQANSVGFMDGGVDRDYVAFFGEALQNKVMDEIDQRQDGVAG